MSFSGHFFKKHSAVLFIDYSREALGNKSNLSFAKETSCIYLTSTYNV